ncbi:unnamed protein product [Nyctereutes procyonoides]|uniref:Vomeronasal type-1 receptor n=1 Tax=Nyctereutes procyonoides TaxID=34880 RepID=A0A811ZUH5_NYCPR|nr:unnamed protein product [Nyctereutes procyonoides]
MSFKSNALRTTGEGALKIILLFQMGTGALANVTLFSCNVSPLLHRHKQRPPHTILTHMAVANLLVLLSAGIPYMMMAFVLRRPLFNLGCKFVYIIYRVAHSTTMCSTCVLSTYQFFTLSWKRVVWMMLRGQVPKVIGSSCCICWMFGGAKPLGHPGCWVFRVLMNACVPTKVTGAQDVGNSSVTRGKWFCLSLSPSACTVILWFVSDTMFIGLMVWSSGSMVLFLAPNSAQKCPLESIAAHTILMLVVTFVSFYVFNSSFAFYVTAFLDFRLHLIGTSSILVFFSTFSAFLLILYNPGAPKFCS